MKLNYLTRLEDEYCYYQAERFRAKIKQWHKKEVVFTEKLNGIGQRIVKIIKDNPENFDNEYKKILE